MLVFRAGQNIPSHSKAEHSVLVLEAQPLRSPVVTQDVNLLLAPPAASRDEIARTTS